MPRSDHPTAPPAPRGADLVLVRSALSGDAGAVEDVLAKLSCVVRFVFRLNRSLGYALPVEALEDVVQQVYAAVWSRLGDFAGGATIESWAFGFCRNCLRAEARRRARLPRVVPGSGGGEPAGVGDPAASALEHRERLDAVRDELARLEPDERRVVELRHLEGWRFEDIARRDGVPPSTVKDRCYRALTKLRGRLRRRDAD